MAVSSATNAGIFNPKVIRIALTGVAATTGGAVAGVLNPLGVDLIVYQAVVQTTTESTGAANLDIGIGATATTSNDTLFDGIAVGTAALLKAASVTHGTNGFGAVKWGAAQYLTVTGSASTAGLVGVLYVIAVEEDVV